MIKPKVLQKGDLVAIAAPASPFDRKEFLIGVKKLRELGFKITFRKDIFSKDRYLAGTDSRRADELNGYFADPNVRAIFFARGGYGTQRILPLLDSDLIKENPKIVVGYSDITSLHIWLQQHGIGGTFYGPTISKHFRFAPKNTLDLLVSMITNNSPIGHLPSVESKVLKNGSAEGRLVGGCLNLIASSIGTPYDLNTDECILFLEDVGEPVYKYDRMLTHMKAAGKLRDVKGIIFGSLGLSNSEKTASLKKMLTSTLANFPGPIVTGFPSGHFDLKKLFVTIPLGVKAKLSTKPVTLEILEPALL